ncbi:LAQU0S19e00540g1_1 [Lachancea quebecensis]|uniref:LAQU0S19e00540g1_1 n=1 Tax=Lachancea quebecensis TaxID=1654605 RepID=A0A0P1KWS8_9SACH|nr:LAQU0S19e00540g1_1 [Lachancea quebecensis]
MTRETRAQDRASNVFRNLSTLSSRERKPLQPRPVNISQLVASQKLRSPPRTPAAAKSPASLLSNAISRSRPKSHDGSMRPVAQVIGKDYHLTPTKPRYHERPKKRYDLAYPAGKALVNRLLKCVSAFETSRRLQRHGLSTHQYDRKVHVHHAKALSPTELLAVATGPLGEEVLVLHRLPSTKDTEPKSGSQLLLSSNSSALLYAGLHWYFEWRVI